MAEDGVEFQELSRAATTNDHESLIEEQRVVAAEPKVNALRYMKIQTWTQVTVLIAIFIGLIAYIAGNVNLHPSRTCNDPGLGKPVYYVSPKTLIKGVKVVDGRSGSIWVQDVVLENGRIIELSNASTCNDCQVVITGNGNYLTPGLTDMHSHAGVYAFPEIWATADGNEATDPTFSQGRALDGFDPEDWAIAKIVSGGVTSAQILPGSANTMGGEGFTVKFGGPGAYAGEVGPPFRYLTDYKVKDGPRAMKMACGENPKRVYGRKGVTPKSRMGSAWVMRQKLEAAQKLMQQQDDWCNGKLDAKRMPTDLNLDSLVALLRGHVNLNVHCYQVQDLQMMVRLSKEFGFKIAAFHHALEAYKIPELLQEEDITVATFADLWGYKYEAYDASVAGPRILEQSGVKVALKSDHPVLWSERNIEMAAKSHFYGLSYHGAINAVTSVPATSVGLGHRVGQVAVGYDADVVIWDKNPLQLGARPALVFIEGVEVHRSDQLKADASNNDKRVTIPMPPPDMPTQTTQATVQIQQSSMAPPMQGSTISTYGISGGTIHDGSTLLSSGEACGNIYVRDGVVSCLGCSCTIPNDVPVFHAAGSWVTPGFIEVGTDLGLQDIGAESSTQDGTLNPSLDNGDIQARDGIMTGSRHVQAAFRGGVSLSITPPQGSAVITGLSTAFDTSGRTFDESEVLGVAAMHVHIDQDAKDSSLSSASISGQIAILRGLLTTTPGRNAQWTAVQQGTLPLVVHCHQADHILAVTRMITAQGGTLSSNIKVIFLGGAEAPLVWSKVTALLPSARLILSPARCIPGDLWPQKRCSEYGVRDLNIPSRIMFARGDPDMSRNLRWEVGNVASQQWGFIDVGDRLWTDPQFAKSKQVYIDAVGSITGNIADAFNLPHGGKIKVGSRAYITVWSANPLTYQGRLLLITAGTFVQQQPLQFGEDRPVGNPNPGKRPIAQS